MSRVDDHQLALPDLSAPTSVLAGPTTRELVAAHREGASWTGGSTGAGGGTKIDLAATGPDTAEVMISATEVCASSCCAGT